MTNSSSTITYRNKPSEALKIGYVLKRFPNLSQTFILNEILEIERQGVLVEIVSLRTPRSEPTHSALKNLKAQITYLDETTKSSDSTIAEQVALWAKSRHLQHLHAHFATSAAEIAMQSAKLANIGYSFTAHAHDIYHEKVDRQALINRIQNARFVVTVSDFNRDYLNKLQSNQSYKGTINRLYNGLDLTLFNPTKLIREPGLIVSIGRLVPKKGMSFLIEAFASLRDRNVTFRAVIIGEGEERVTLEKSIQKFALEQQVTLVGALTQSDVIATLSRAELFALSCIVGDDGDMDGLPTVILEAMALGIPVVSTQLAGIPEMIHHQINGLLVDQKQVTDLADAMQTLLESNELRISFRNQSLKHMEEHFNLRKNVAQLREWFAAASTIGMDKEYTE
ncbi:MAG: glycosyltransferase family 4 protein [Methylococcaceae bacterium]|nr:glycosyltransferase family 4 protein [Methylococcaceae bacterium]